MTFGDLWRLIERHRVSPDLRVVYYSGRFGLPKDRCTIYNGKEPIVNVPLGDIPVDKCVFIWNELYTGMDQLREAAPPVGTILKILKDANLIRGSKVVDALIEKSRHIERIEVYNEASEILVAARDKEELERQLYIQNCRMRGLIPQNGNQVSHR